MLTAIRARDLHKSFTSQTKGLQTIKALDGLSLEIYQGEVLGILGPNGAGKTTFLNILSTLLTPDKGSVEILGIPLLERNFPRILRLINLSSGYPNFPWSLTVEENLKFYGRLYGLGGKELNAKTAQLIEMFKLGSCFRQRFDELSSGTKQRLSLAKAFLNDPKIIFLDEPTVGLDPDAAVQTREIISATIKNRGVTVILTTHNMPEAQLMCERIAFIKEGKILQAGAVSEIRKTFGGKDLEQIFIELARSKVVRANEAAIFSGKMENVASGHSSPRPGNALAQWLNRVGAFCYRNYLFAVRNVFTFMELVFWPLVTFISIGLLGDFLSVGTNAMAFILTGAIAGGILQVTQLDVAYSLLYEVWSKSIKHLFLTPMGMSEHLFGSWLVGMARGSALFAVLGWAAVRFFGFPLPAFKVTAVFLLGIYACAVLLGLLVSFLVLIFGQKAEVTAWMFAYVAMLVSGIYYPIDILPPFFVQVAKWVPVTYFLEYFRRSFGFEGELAHPILKGFGLIAMYLAIGLGMLKFALRQARKKGTLVRLSE
ncbi:MAG TPA: ABC transporter ATP-binding protein/permease [Candidatus Omnitrophota bacterium]|nr:ABC transporter ATP-binding protein/permease [Candidatus Omnitrophota bacterium]